MAGAGAAFSGEVPFSVFEAYAETTTEARFQWQLAKSRAKWAREHPGDEG
jgi:hypothetical protein